MEKAQAVAKVAVEYFAFDCPDLSAARESGHWGAFGGVLELWMNAVAIMRIPLLALARARA